jgi:hypothetical protein
MDIKNGLALRTAEYKLNKYGCVNIKIMYGASYPPNNSVTGVYSRPYRPFSKKPPFFKKRPPPLPPHPPTTVIFEFLSPTA